MLSWQIPPSAGIWKYLNILEILGCRQGKALWVRCHLKVGWQRYDGVNLANLGHGLILNQDLTLESGGELVNPVAGLRLLYKVSAHVKWTGWSYYRFGKCEWSEEDKPFQLPITQVSFDLLTKEWGIPSLFLKFIGGFNTRAHKFSAYLGNGHDAKGWFIAEQSRCRSYL